MKNFPTQNQTKEITGIMPNFQLLKKLPANKILALANNQKHSLYLRLSLLFSSFLVIIWLGAALFTWWESREYVGEFFDTQQLLLAKTLATTPLGWANGELPDSRDFFKGIGKKGRGREEDDALGFAVFSKDGRPLLTDGENNFNPANWQPGFTNSHIKNSDDLWRIVWLASPDGERIIAVGQELDYRDEMVYDMLWQQMLPWLLVFPILLAGVIFVLYREFSPLRRLAQSLEQRQPQDTTPIDQNEAPAEIRPFISALNLLFTKMEQALTREKAFVSDAAHELRTPLAGLRLQAEVIEMAHEDEATRRRAVGLLLAGIDRSSHLIDQLLTLSGLDSKKVESETMARPNVTLAAYIIDFLEAQRELIDQKQLTVERQLKDDLSPSSEMIQILLRNVLDNALKYTNEGGRIVIELNSEIIKISNTCPPIATEYAKRLGERFFRPPGQNAPGSGLGLSIARRIAEQEKWNMVFGIDENGFAVKINFKKH